MRSYADGRPQDKIATQAMPSMNIFEQLVSSTTQLG